MRYLAQMLVLAGSLLPLAHADELDKQVVLTVNDPIEVNHVVLTPGRYIVRFMDSESAPDRFIEVFTGDQKHLVTTVLVTPIYRTQPTSDVRVKLWETAAGTPQALRSLYFPGDNYGVQFPAPPEARTQTITNAD